MQRPPSGPPGRRFALIRLALLALAIAVAIAVVVLVVRPTPGAVRGRVGDVRDWVDGIGPLAPLLFIAVSASLTPLMFPGPLLAGASGLLFGTALGFPVSLASAVLGATIAFVIARSVAPDAVEHFAGPRLAALEELVSRRGFLSVLYARIAPGVPYTALGGSLGNLRSPEAAIAVAVLVVMGSVGLALLYRERRRA